MRNTTLATILTILALSLAACGGSDDAAEASDTGSDSAAAPAADGATISIQDFSFSGTLTVAPGETVTVVNDDSAPHTVTNGDGAFDTGSVSGGDSTTFTAPSEPGTYDFFCSIHPSMQGQLIVEG